jgi:tetratricopeptide (TPR) repeat protein
MQRVLYLSSTFALHMLLAAPASANDWQDCMKTDAQLRITACSAVITKGADTTARMVSAYNQRGRGYAAQNDHDRAIADYEEASRLNPKYIHAHNNRGLSQHAKGSFDQAIASYDEALKLDPKFDKAYNNRGLSYLAKRDYDHAITDFTESAHITPKYTFAYNNRALAFHAKGQYDQAIADLSEAIRLDPKYAHAYYNRGRTQNAKRAYDLAIADLDEAIRLDPNYTRAYNLRGQALRAKGDTERAVRDFRQVVASAAATAEDRQRQESARESLERLTTQKAKSAPAQDPKRVALVIGNSAYAHAGALPNPKNDAREVAATLRRLGFEEVMEHHDLGREAMSKALKAFGDRATNAEWAVVFYAGHGLEMGGTNYLVPIDAELQRDSHVTEEAVSLDRVQAKVDSASKLGLVILDACRNNPFLPRMTRSAGGVRAIGRGLANVEPDGNVLVAFAARHGNVAEDGAGTHSPFTEALLAHIEDPQLEVSFLFRKVRDAVRAKTERRQEPFVYGSLGSEPLFFKTSAR